jgi:hypothetical protein
VALAHYYPDEYLRAHVTMPRENRAETEVADIGEFPATWIPRLVVLRAYLIVCMECQREQDDLFSTKLATYRKEFDTTLSLARAAQTAASTGTSQRGGGSLFSVETFRA